MGDTEMTLTDIEKIHYNNLQMLLSNSSILTTDMQHALVFALECIEDEELRSGERCGDNCKGECSGEVDGTVHCPPFESDQGLMLKKLTEKFVIDREIGSAEAIYQCDSVIENACEFIESLCDIVGYYDYENGGLCREVD